MNSVILRGRITELSGAGWMVLRVEEERRVDLIRVYCDNPLGWKLDQEVQVHARLVRHAWTRLDEDGEEHGGTTLQVRAWHIIPTVCDHQSHALELRPVDKDRGWTCPVCHDQSGQWVQVVCPDCDANILVHDGCADDETVRELLEV
jgi:hypothetical protein